MMERICHIPNEIQPAIPPPGLFGPDGALPWEQFPGYSPPPDQLFPDYNPWAGPMFPGDDWPFRPQPMIARLGPLFPIPGIPGFPQSSRREELYRCPEEASGISLN